MKKNKGMKIYRQKKKNGKNSNQILSLLGTCAVVFGVGIFGYYVVAVPVYDLITSAGDDTSDISSSKTAEVTTGPKVTEDGDTTVSSVKKIFSDLNEKTSSETTKPAVTTVPESTKTTKPSQTKTEAQVTKAPVLLDEGGSYYLTTSDISDLNTLVERLNNIHGYSSVVLPLKVTGGKLYYKSNVETASLAGVISSDVSLYDMVRIISECGMEPVAEISTIADNIYPLTYKKSAYQFDDGVTGEWLDNKPDNGGKPWLSPFSDYTISYLSDITSEITSAGIKKVICTDTYFPAFRDKDLGYIGDLVNPETRYKGLTDLINTLNSKASANNGEVMLSVSASDIINSSSEVFKPDELGKISAVVTINMNDFSGQSIGDIMNKIKDKSGSMKVVPCIISSSVSASDLTSIVDSLINSGYKYYMVK